MDYQQTIELGVVNEDKNAKTERQEQT